MASLAQFDRRRGADRPGIAGVDEAGRGSLAGPVVAAAVWLDGGFYADAACLRRVRGANDSKELTASQREDLRGRIEELRAEGKLRATWAQGSVVEIAALNILGATRAAMARCLAGLDAAARPARPFAAARWSSPHALADTLANFTGRRIALLHRRRDVDTAEDLAAIGGPR